MEKYKRRLEDMAELRQQVKELDDLNSKYLDQMLKLESTAKTIPTLTAKIEQYKNQVHTLLSTIPLLLTLPSSLTLPLLLDVPRDRSAPRACRSCAAE